MYKKLPSKEGSFFNLFEKVFFKIWRFNIQKLIDNEASFSYSLSPLDSITFLYHSNESFFSRLKSPVPSSNLLT